MLVAEISAYVNDGGMHHVVYRERDRIGGVFNGKDDCTWVKKREGDHLFTFT